MRRVVVTGIGAVTPLATGAEETWARLLNSESSAATIRKFETADLATNYACEIKPKSDEFPDGFNPDEWATPKDQRRVDGFIIYGLAAAKQALADSGYVADTDEKRFRSGVMVGSGIGGLQGIEEGARILAEQGPRRLSPFFIPGRLINLLSGHISIENKFMGPNSAVVAACSTGAHAIGDAARIIALDDADVMVAGGAEAALSRIGIAGFAAAKALSSGFKDAPERASRPWDQGRDGFVMGEGAGIVVLEELEHARARGAKIYGEVIGYGMSGDAYHITAPSEDGSGAYRCMAAAMKRAGIDTSDIDYINAHGTSTPRGDEIELKAIRRLLGNDTDGVTMSSTKSSIGHLLGAAGSVEAIFCLMAMRNGIPPPTLNLENPDESSEGLDLSPLRPTERKINVALSNSFGFGGTNASLIFRRLDD